MKRIIYVTYLFITVVFATAQVFAQTNDQSRLNMAYKKKPAGTDKPSLLYSPMVVNNRPLILENSKALSTFYRALLFGEGSAAQSAGPDSGSMAVVSAQRTEPKAVTFEELNAENESLFANDKITVRNLYPNPANDYAYLEYTMTSAVKDAKISFYNVLGATVKEYTLARASQKLDVDTRLMPNGVYFYQLTVDGHKVATKKLVIRHH